MYSFGIILQEVALLHGVFYLDTQTLTPRGWSPLTCPILSSPCSWSPPDLSHPVLPLLTSHLSPPEIVQVVRQGRTPPLRPALCSSSHSEELGVLMQRCWSEDPGDRPDFSTIKVLLRKQHR